mmetsp:Transcript_19979/g.46493  ORF Transcript_19979/g.46493 Transcript_19979/m.46493 type:complete len:518 (-) Transcript_19979:60-1613(-)
MQQVQSLNASMTTTSWAAEQLASASERLAAVFHFIGAELQGVLGDFCLAQDDVNDDIRAVMELLLAWREVGEFGVVFAGNMLAIGTQARKISVQVEFERTQRMHEAEKLRKVLADATADPAGQLNSGNPRWRNWFAKSQQKEQESAEEREGRRNVAEACLEQLTRQMEATEQRGREELAGVVKQVYQRAKPLGAKVSELKSSWRGGAKCPSEEAVEPASSESGSAAWVFETPPAADGMAILASSRMMRASSRSKGHSNTRRRGLEKPRRKSARRNRRTGGEEEEATPSSRQDRSLPRAPENVASDDDDTLLEPSHLEEAEDVPPHEKSAGPQESEARADNVAEDHCTVDDAAILQASQIASEAHVQDACSDTAPVAECSKEQNGVVGVVSEEATVALAGDGSDACEDAEAAAEEDAEISCDRDGHEQSAEPCCKVVDASEAADERVLLAHRDSLKHAVEGSETSAELLAAGGAEEPEPAPELVVPEDLPPKVASSAEGSDVQKEEVDGESQDVSSDC